MDFFRFLFDHKRSNPFSQFYNKELLKEVKGQARLLMLQGSSPLRPGEIKRKFVSEVQKLQRDSKGSITVSGDAAVGAGTRASNNQHVSSFSGLNLKQLIEEHEKISDN